METQTEEIIPEELADRMLSLYAEDARQSSIDFEINLGEGVSEQQFVSDKARLEQILRNLLSNAFKFTEKNGSIHLDIGLTAASTMYFAVKDTGIGIPESGVGLSLSTSRELAQELGGDIEVQSEGNGSVFTLYLPVRSAGLDKRPQ